MKRTERVGAMIEILTQSPNKVGSLTVESEKKR